MHIFIKYLKEISYRRHSALRLFNFYIFLNALHKQLDILERKTKKYVLCANIIHVLMYHNYT